jgi:hypothetical protein
MKEIKEILDTLDVKISEDEIDKYLSQLKGHVSREDSMEAAIFITLIRKWEKEGQRVITMSPTKEPNTFPSTLTLGILGVDWPGMLEGCSSCIHEGGWNISFIKGITLEYKGKKLALLTLKIDLKSKDEFDRFLSCKNEIVEGIELLSVGDQAERFLISRESKKLRDYERTIKETKKRAKGKLLEGLIEEASKFFAARTGEYLEERKPETLANQIITNYKFMNGVRNSGGRIHSKVEHIKTIRERLTGITVVGFDRDLSLNDCLNAIQHAVPEYRVMYNKEFTTQDGISVYRIEIDGFQNIKAIESALAQLAFGKRFAHTRLLESIGGFEQYARAIIPQLVKEYTLAHIPQVYISPTYTSQYFIEFKIIIVIGKGKGHVMYTQQLNGIKGFSILSIKPPESYGGSQVNIVDLRVNLDLFPEPERIYETIKDILKNEIGEFRDFDEGMRRIDIKKLAGVRTEVKRGPADLVRQFYYSLEDFYRIGAPIEEITDLIKTGIQLYKKTKSLPDKCSITMHNLEACTIIGIASKEDLLRETLSILGPYNTNVSKLEIGEFSILLFRASEDNKPIKGKERLLKQLKKCAKDYLSSHSPS